MPTVSAKGTRARMGKGSGDRAKAPLELIHADLITDVSGETEIEHTLVIVDDFSGYVHAQPLSRKSDALEALQNWVTLMENQTGHKLKAIRTDNGGEWASNIAINWKTAEGFLWQKTAPYVSVQNGRVERMNRTLMERMRTMLMQ